MVKFEKGKDRVIIVGDLVGKGPDGQAVVKFCRENKFESVRGNHGFESFFDYFMF